MVQAKDKVFILRTIRYGDADLIVHGLNPQGARLNFFARSALKSKKRFGGGVLEPTHFVQVTYDDKSRKGEGQSLHVLKEALLLQGFPGLRRDYARIQMALYCVQLILEVVREGDVHSASLFDLFGNTLRAAETTPRLDLLRIHFEVKLLASQGVLPHQGSEEVMRRVPIMDHERLSLDDGEWLQVQQRVNHALNAYLKS